MNTKLMAKDLQIGQQVNELFMATDVRTGTTSKGSNALWLSLQDMSGSIPAVLWDCPPGLEVAAGKVYRAKGSCSEYKGKPQVRLDSLAEERPASMEYFEKVTKFRIEDLWLVIEQSIAAMRSRMIRDVAEDIMLSQGLDAAFKRSPAATGMHHAFVGGLLEHTSQMCETVDALFSLPCYSRNLNKDLCMFGVIFHDFGKIFEYEHSGAFKKTMQGILVPHIPMTAAMIYDACRRLETPEVVRDHLMHVILAHHGRIEWGSPVAMAFPEAAFVHHVDHLHGDVFGWLQKIEDPKEELVWTRDRTLVSKRFNSIIEECETTSSTSF